MTDSIEVPARFNGPLDSGNGGYSCGVIAAALDGPAKVDLRSPVPLDTKLAIASPDTASIRVLAGDVLVAEARRAEELDLEIPPPITVEEARDASTRYRGVHDGPFSGCFVCGRDRGDALGVFAGRVPGRNLVASPWTPPAWSADGAGMVRPEIVWAALDCPTFFAAYLERDPLPVAFLVRQQARLDTPVATKEEHVVISWPIEVDGRRSLAGSAVLSGAGAILATARVLLVEPQSG